jgi:nitrite reductase (NADH) large subunit
MDVPRKPRYLRLRIRVPAGVWTVARCATVSMTLALAVLLAVDPGLGMLLFWGLAVPAVPLTWALAPGLWRNICPMAAANQVPRVLGLSLGRRLPGWLERHGYGLAFAAFFLLTALRPVLFQEAAGALALLLGAALVVPVIGGIVFRGKSGFCGSLCPLRPAQGLYSRAPAVKVERSHCTPCVGCSAACPDLKPESALLEELEDPDQLRSGYRLLFAGALAGFTYAFFTLPPLEQIGLGGLTTRLLGAMLVGAGLVFALHTLTGARLGHLTALFGAASLAIFYWFNVPTVAATIGELIGEPVEAWAVWEARGVLAVLIAAWLVRGLRLAGAFSLVRQPPAAVAPVVAPAGAGVTLPLIAAGLAAPAPPLREEPPVPAPSASLPMAGDPPPPVDRRARIVAGEPAVPIPDRRAPDRPMRPPAVTFWPEGSRVEVEAGTTVARAARAAGVALPEGCNAGMCGCDPVYVLDGAGALSAVSEDEGSTLLRIGLPAHARLACSAEVHGDVTVSIAADAVLPTERSGDPAVAPAATVLPAVGAAPPAVPGSGVERVVVLGNGIAGITAAGYVRRLDQSCAIDLVTASAHPFYNRIAVTRLIHDRAGMRRMQLLPDSWYEAQRIEQWLNTSATRIDRTRQRVLLGTGETLEYDRLVLATGARATMPPLDGIGLPGVFGIRSADDAVDIRAYVQDQRCRRAVVVGGGLLGLEAADALDQLDIDCTVVERGAWLGHSELDRRSGALLAEQLEGRGIDVVAGTSVRAIGGDARAEGVELSGGRTLTADVVIVCAGITPNAELARDAGLAVGRGVAVDASMRTSDPAVFACGDVAEVDGIVSGRWPAAVAQGEIAAVTALGGERTYDARPIPTRLKVTGLELTAIGRQEARPGDEVIVHEAEGSYRRLVVTRDRLRGAVAFGPAPGLDAVVAAVREGRHVTTLLDDLRAGDWTVLDRRSTGPAAARRAA